MGPCIIYCVSCGKHAFRVDANTVQSVGVLVLQCPACGKATKVGFDSSNQELIVTPTNPERESDTERLG